MPTAAIIPEVSIVIPSWNGLPLLEPCLAAVSALTGVRFQAIVVDNGSTDGTAEFVTERHPEVKLVRLSSNRGFAAAANAGFRAADTQYVALLNNDVVVAPAWLAELVACGERHPRAAAVASKLLRPDEATIDRVGDLLARNLRAYPQGASERDRGQYDEEREVFSVSGAACLWRARVFEELGGFDEGFFFAYEDVDLGLRARLRGFECWTAPRSLALQVG
jgi:GT2 family glycosyltransferase